MAATNRDLRAMMKKGEFREDLYYRLSSAAITIPPLRQTHRGDPELHRAFCRTLQQTLRQEREVRIAREAVVAMCRYPWPGNIRELAHVIETAVLMTDLDRLTIIRLPAQVLNTPADPDAPMPAPAPFGDPAVASLLSPSSQPLSEQNWTLPDKSPLLLDDVIKKTLLRSWQQSGGNRRRAADLLGVSRSTLYRMWRAMNSTILAVRPRWAPASSI